MDVDKLPVPDPEGYCIKCGSGHEEIHVRWIAMSSERTYSFEACRDCRPRYTAKVFEEECLHKSCKKCGYCWRTHTHEWLEDEMDGKAAEESLEDYLKAEAAKGAANGTHS